MNRFYTTLGSETAVSTSEPPRDELERLHDKQLMSELLLLWEVMAKVIQKDTVLLEVEIVAPPLGSMECSHGNGC